MSSVEECLICGKPLKYFDETKELNCAVCGKMVPSKASCVDGHFLLWIGTLSASKSAAHSFLENKERNVS